MIMGGFVNYVFIINPITGKRKGIDIVTIINEYCISKNINYKVVCTKDVGHAEYLASLYKNLENTVIYSVGGDGTLNEVINGMVNSKASLGIIPIGSGNDFYKSLIESNDSIIDLGKVNDKYFINIASIGLDAEIVLGANNLKGYDFPNELIYITSLVNNYFKYDCINVKLDEVLKELTILTICNGKYYGRGFKIAPNAKLNDGLFDVVEVDKISKLKIIKLLCKLSMSKHLTDKDVKYYKTNNITVESPFALNCNIDGEIIAGRIFNFNIVSNVLRLYKTDELKINELLKEKKIIK